MNKNININYKWIIKVHSSFINVNRLPPLSSYTKAVALKLQTYRYCMYTLTLELLLIKIIKYGSRTASRTQVSGVTNTRRIAFKQWPKTVYLIIKRTKVLFKSDQKAA